MITEENKNGLKGQYILAQGNPGETGRRPGLKNRKENRPRGDVYNSKNYISDELYNLVLSRNNVLQFRPEGVTCIIHRILADEYSPVSFTQGGVSDRSSRNCALGYTILAFQARKTNCNFLTKPTCSEQT